MEAVEDERQRSEATISELKERINTFVSSRKELDDRLADQIKEMRTIKADNATIVSGLNVQNESLQDEISQIRSKAAMQREQLADFQDFKKRYWLSCVGLLSCVCLLVMKYIAAHFYCLFEKKYFLVNSSHFTYLSIHATKLILKDFKKLIEKF